MSSVVHRNAEQVKSAYASNRVTRRREYLSEISGGIPLPLRGCGVEFNLSRGAKDVKLKAIADDSLLRLRCSRVVRMPREGIPVIVASLRKLRRLLR